MDSETDKPTLLDAVESRTAASLERVADPGGGFEATCEAAEGPGMEATVEVAAESAGSSEVVEPDDSAGSVDS